MKSDTPSWTVGLAIAVTAARVGKSIKQISRETGIKPYTLMSRILTDQAQLPYDKVAVLASTLTISPQGLLRMCLAQYEPEAWKALQELLPGVSSQHDIAASEHRESD